MSTELNREQILALAEGVELFVASDNELIAFFHAAIASYKAELLKEVGEPVLYAEFAEDGGWLGDASEYADHLEEPHALFTSDQVSAAILKATKPLEDQLAAAQEEIAELKQSREFDSARTGVLARLVNAAYPESKDIQLGCIGTILGSVRLATEAIIKERDELKAQLATAEQRVAEWQPIETAP